MSYQKIKSQPLSKVNKCFIDTTECSENAVSLFSVIPAKGNSLSGSAAGTTIKHLTGPMSCPSLQKFAEDTTELADI